MADPQSFQRVDSLEICEIATRGIENCEGGVIWEAVVIAFTIDRASARAEVAEVEDRRAYRFPDYAPVIY